jgi:hypothetical protein
LSNYCNGESFKQCIYFQKCTYVFTMHGISSARRQYFSSADDAGVSSRRQKSQASASFAEFPVYIYIYIYIYIYMCVCVRVCVCVYVCERQFPSLSQPCQCLAKLIQFECTREYSATARRAAVTRVRGGANLNCTSQLRAIFSHPCTSYR